MAEMWGADANGLDELARRFVTSAASLDGTASGLRSMLYTTPWHGGDAEGFRTEWDSTHAKVLLSAAAFLRESSELLQKQAREQRRASEAESGASTGSQPGGGDGKGEGEKDKDDKPDWMKQFEELLELLGIPPSVHAKILETLEELKKAGLLDEEMLDFLAKLKDNKGFVKFLGILGHAVDVGTVLVDFVKDFAGSEGPMDERLLHATLVATVNFGISQGLDVAMTALGGVIGTMIFPGPGSAAGIVTGKVVGFVLGEVAEAGYGALDDKFHITDAIADQGVEVYKYLKDHDFDISDAAYDYVTDVAGDAVDSAMDTAGDAVDAAQDAVGSAVDTAGDVAGAVGDKLSFWN